MHTTTDATPTPLSRALETIRRLKAQLSALGAHQPIAVVGVGMRLPGGIDHLDAYWQVLAAGADLVRPMPDARKGPFAAAWDALPRKGGFLDDVTGFDAEFFGISPRESRALDPQHRLLLAVAWEALENAALPPDRIHGARTGLYVGITGQDYRDWLPDHPDAYWATGNGHCFAAGRLAYAMGLSGPALAVDTACSSGLVAVHLAVQALRRGECELALAGGVNLILSPRSTRMIQETRALAPDGTCKTFDARANGFARGEGCGVVVLKRLDHALRDGDHVHAVIQGSAINHDGRSSGFTAPNVRSQIALIEAALADAGLAPADIGLVEAHGTGTALGDPIEMEAVVSSLGRKNGGAPLHVGSAKTNLGHLEAAAGLAGLLKAIACCARRQVPGLVHFQTLNPRIDTSGAQIRLSSQLEAWHGEAGRFAAVSSFGLSGTNAHLIVGAPDAGEAPPAQAVTGFAISARSRTALRELASRFARSLAALPADAYAAFAYTATFGRAHHAVGARITAADPASAIAALTALACDLPSPAVSFEATLTEALPRRVAQLPCYPWQREAFVPSTLPAAASSVIAEPAGDVRGQVRRLVAQVLGHADVRAVSDDASFFDLGLDSLMAVDLARALVSALAVELSFSDVLDHASVAALADLIHARATSAPDVTVPTVAAVPTAVEPRSPRVAFVFSCQGQQYFGMGRDLYASEPVVRARIDACDRILAPQLGVSLVDIMMRGGDPDAIHRTHLMQPAQVALQLALADLWQAWGVTASAVIGHSLGEVAAAIHAGVLDLEAGLTLVVHRARIMQSAPPGAMLAIEAPRAQIETWLAGSELDIAAINGPEAIVVSGAVDAIDALAGRLARQRVRTQRIAVSVASHSRLMAPVLPALRAAIAGLAHHAPRVPIIANLTGRLAAPGDYSADYWCRHVREPVRFADGIAALRALDIDTLVEVGPDRAMIRMVSAAGLLPAAGGISSLRRGSDARTAMLDARAALTAPRRAA